MSTAIEVVDLVRRFGDLEAIRGIGFEVAEGELYGLIGPDGAGKTTTIRALAGLIGLDGGLVRILGADPTRDGRRVRETLGLMPQYYSLYGDLTVGENLRFFGRLFCLSRADYKSRSSRLLDITRLATFVDRRADALSGGMYKKLALACALLHQPQVLLLDEPTNGVDPISRRELWELLYEFVADGMSILVSTPYMDEAERCHRIGLLHEGQLLAQGDPSRLVRELPQEAIEISGGDRDRLQTLLEANPAVLLVSPAGERIRAVIEPGTTAAITETIEPLGAMVRSLPSSFEDLFLVRLAAMNVADEAST